MKKIKILTSLALFAAVLFTSCGDVEPLDPAVVLNGGNNGNVATGVFKVDFDGQTFTATTTQAVVNDDYIAITGMKANGQMFQITLPNGEEGTYAWDSFEPTSGGFALAYMPSAGAVPYLGARDDEGAFADFSNYVDTAELVISDIDTQNHVISGTFKFTGVRFTASGTAVETKSFTNGSFSLSFAPDVVAPTGNTFFAKLDGANFTPSNISGIKANGKISIVGRRGSVENIGLSLPDDITPGTYNLDFFAGNYVGLYVRDSSATGAFGSDTGSVTITSHDTATKKIVGTFNFEATSFVLPDTYDITNGTFSVTYQ